jgi:hypothetical protein
MDSIESQPLVVAPQRFTSLEWNGGGRTMQDEVAGTEF